MTSKSNISPNEQYVLDGWLRLNSEIAEPYVDGGLKIEQSDAGYVIRASVDPSRPLVLLSAHIAEKYQRLGALLAASALIFAAQQEKNSHTRIAQLYTQVDAIMTEYGFTDEEIHGTLQRIAESRLNLKRPKAPTLKRPD